MQIKKTAMLFFLLLLPYIVFSLECSTTNDCNDDSYCTTESCNSGNCSYANVGGCIKDNFKFVGDSFAMGEGSCRNTYEYDGVYREDNKIVLVKGSETISLNFNNNLSNYYGHPIIYDFKILNATVAFNLRYNETQNFLYLEDVNKTCPVVDQCSSNENCTDDNVCTIDECTGTPLACKHSMVAYCKSNDGCCPGKCNATNDNDCITDQCSTNEDCNDNNPCTNDLCDGTPKLCVNAATTDCADNDNCCPAGCAYNTDKDCEKPIICGDNICEANETKENCCKDCDCAEDYECAENRCQKTKKAIAKESLEINEDFRKKQEKLLSDGFSLNKILFSETAAGFSFEYTYSKGDKERAIKGVMDSQGKVKQINTAGGAPVLWYAVILVLIFLITIAGLSHYRNFRHKKEEEKEKYYAGLLQQKFQKPRQPFYRR